MAWFAFYAEFLCKSHHTLLVDFDQPTRTAMAKALPCYPLQRHEKRGMALGYLDGFNMGFAVKWKCLEMLELSHAQREIDK